MLAASVQFGAKIETNRKPAFCAGCKTGRSFKDRTRTRVELRRCHRYLSFRF